MEVRGIEQIINGILEDLGYPADACYVAPNLWEISRGSARISISYDRNSGFLYGDARLCLIPDDPPYELLAYLLNYNDSSGRLRLSVKDRAVILSWSAYDKYLDAYPAEQLIAKHLQEADDLDNYLVQHFGCKWPGTDN